MWSTISRDIGVIGFPRLKPQHPQVKSKEVSVWTCVQLIVTLVAAGMVLNSLCGRLS